MRADTQRAGRGRHGRTWLDAPGASLLFSLALRGDQIPADPSRAWRVGAELALAAADAIEDGAYLTMNTVALKWPNDLVLRTIDGGVTSGFRKVGGALAEASALGTPDATLVVGMGINVRGDVARLDPTLAASATSLELASGRPVDREAIFDDLVARLTGRLAALAAGRFDVAGWRARQLLDGCEVEVTGGGVSAQGGTTSMVGRVVGHDGGDGALLVEVDGVEHRIAAGEVTRVRLSGPSASPTA